MARRSDLIHSSGLRPRFKEKTHVGHSPEIGVPGRRSKPRLTSGGEAVLRLTVFEGQVVHH